MGWADDYQNDPPADDEEKKPPPPQPSTGSPFLDALIGAVTGADLPSGGTNAAVDDPRGYGPAYDAPPGLGGVAFAPPVGNAGMDDPRGYGDAYGGRPSPNDAGGTGVAPYGPPAPDVWGSSNAAPPVAETPWDQAPYFPGAPAQRDWGSTNAAPTPTEIPPFAGGLFDPWTGRAEAAGTTKNPITAMREAEETQTARSTNASATAQAGAYRDARTATAQAVNEDRRAAASATADARRDQNASATETARQGAADRTAVAQETRDARGVGATATKEALMQGTPTAQAQARATDTAATATKEARSEAATATREAQSANATATREAVQATPTATRAPDPDKDAAEGARLLGEAMKLEADAPADPVTGERTIPPEAQMIREQAQFLLGRARAARNLPTYTPAPAATATPTAGPSATPTPAPALAGAPVVGGLLDAIGALFRRGTPTPEAATIQPDLDTGTMLQYGTVPDATPGPVSSLYKQSDADAIAAARNAEDVPLPAPPPAPRTRTSATPTLPVGEYGGDTSGGALPIDPDLMTIAPTAAGQQAAVDAFLAKRHPPAAAPALPPIAASVGAPGEPGALPPPEEGTAPPPRHGAVVPPTRTQTSGTGGVAIAPAVEQYRPIFERYFGADADHAMQLATLESGGNADAHNTRGEDSRGLMQINVGPGANTGFRNRDLFNPEENIRTAAQIKARQGWGAWSTEALLQRGGQDRAMPGAGGLPGTVSPGDMTAGATAGRPRTTNAADLDAAVEQAGGREAAMPGARGATPAPGTKTPRPALTGNEAVDNANWIVWMRQNNPGWTPPAAEETTRAKAPAGPHKGDLPTNKPAAADPGFRAGPALPVSPSNTYRLADGTVKTLDEMKTELRAAGWAGNVDDVQAVLQAYQRTTGKTLTPTAAVLTPAQRQAQVARWTPNVVAQGAGLNVPADVALAAIDFVSQGDPQHPGGLMGVPAAKLPAGAPATDGDTSIKAGLALLAAAYKANGNDWTKAFQSYLTQIGVTPQPTDVQAFNERRNQYAAPAPA